MKVNLNHELLCLSKLNFGRYQAVEIKVGRITYYYDITIDGVHAYIVRRWNGGKIHHGVWVKRNAILDREFFDDYEEIVQAQYVQQKYKTIIV